MSNSNILAFISCSLRYHRLHPEYIHTRIKKLGHMYTLRILLVMCDVVSDKRQVRKEIVGFHLTNRDYVLGVSFDRNSMIQPSKS